MATMTDVAKAANVSVMTVSRVLNNSGYVKQETRAAIEKAIKDLDYRPNLLAKSLVTGRSNIIAYVLSDISDQFYGSVCKGVEDTCLSRGYTAVICNADAHTSVDNYIDMIIDRKLDGVIFHHLPVTPAQIALLSEHDIQCVTVDNEIALEQVSSIDSDDYMGAVNAVKYLYSRGYRNIGCVCGEDQDISDDQRTHQEAYQHRIWEDRTRGYYDGLKACGLEPGGVYYGRGSADMHTSFECGRSIMKSLLDEETLPDALYCQSDIIAMGVLNVLLETDKQHVRDIGIVGHDGLDICNLMHPRLTTVVQPKYEMGMTAANMLLDKVDTKELPIEHKIVESHLYIGKTTR